MPPNDSPELRAAIQAKADQNDAARMDRLRRSARRAKIVLDVVYAIGLLAMLGLALSAVHHNALGAVLSALVCLGAMTFSSWVAVWRSRIVEWTR